MSPSHVRSESRSAQVAAASVPDWDLVNRARLGDPVAFELIMRRHNQRLFRLTRSILKDGHETEDVIQATFVRAFQKLDTFTGPQGFSAWLGKIAMNEAYGRLRGRGRVIYLDDHLAAGDEPTRARKSEVMRSEQPGPERLAANRELRRLLENAIDALPDEFRTVFVLRAVEGVNTEEAAQQLSIKPATVKTRFHRARRLLQSTLGEEWAALTPSTFEFAGNRCDRVVANVFARLGLPFPTASD